MASLPNPNPIDAGYLTRGAAVDHLGSERIHCEACGSEQKAEIYKMILGRSGGFGAPVFIKPFLKHGSTKGKIGHKGVYALCCKCSSLWSRDQGARDSLAREGFDPDGVIPEHMAYEVLNRAAGEIEKQEQEHEPESELGGLPPTSRVKKLDTGDPLAPEAKETNTPEAVEAPKEPQVPTLDEEVPPAPATEQSEVTELPKQSRVRKLDPEAVEQPTETKLGRLGAKPAAKPTNPAVEEDPEVILLREKLADAEREAQEKMERRREAEEAEVLRAEKAQLVDSLTQELAEAEARLAELRELDPVGSNDCGTDPQGLED